MIRARQVRDSGRVVGCAGVVVDVSDRHRVESSLRELIDRYRQLVDLSPDGILVHQAGTIVYANRAGIELVGAHAVGEVVGRSIIDFVHPDSIGPTLERAILDSGRKTLNPDIAMPIVAGYDDAEVTRLSAEHCQLKLGPKSQDLKIGDKVELIVGYGDFTTVLHDEFHGFRNNRLEVVWPILGRGKLT